MNLPRKHSDKVIQSILPRKIGGAGTAIYSRTPLNIDFASEPEINPIAPAEQIELDQVNDSQIFNAIGSRYENGTNMHLPVIDADGGAKLQKVKGSKVIIRSSSSYNHQTIRAYRPDSMLRDVLGDNDIDLEVFDYPITEHSRMSGRTRIAGKAVTAIVLRSEEANAFHVASSTQKDHSHVYIQHEFSNTDHDILISELGKIGIVSERWQQIVEQEGMGIVRAPWTEKEITHRPS